MMESAASLAYFMHTFSETTKMRYRGEEDDGELVIPHLTYRAHKLIMGCGNRSNVLLYLF
jgi:hypothetical protein